MRPGNFYQNLTKAKNDVYLILNRIPDGDEKLLCELVLKRFCYAHKQTQTLSCNDNDVYEQFFREFVGDTRAGEFSYNEFYYKPLSKQCSSLNWCNLVVFLLRRPFVEYKNLYMHKEVQMLHLLPTPCLRDSALELADQVLKCYERFYAAGHGIISRPTELALPLHAIRTFCSAPFWNEKDLYRAIMDMIKNYFCGEKSSFFSARQDALSVNAINARLMNSIFRELKHYVKECNGKSVTLKKLLLISDRCRTYSQETPFTLHGSTCTGKRDREDDALPPPSRRHHGMWG
ncbi:MAG: hypothetical protein K0S08_2178 [Gammaproteobacteria bacterium]|nr:hypothetical protein [Gammaproteobacteria bacterium]